MSNIEVLVDLEKQGKLKPLVRAGLFPSKTYLHMNIFLKVNQLVKDGIKPNQAVQETEEAFKVCRATVYNAIKVFK